MIQESLAGQTQPVEAAPAPLKPLMRGWSHALAAAGALALTIVLCAVSRSDPPRLLSLLIYGLSMIELYTVSALYHMGRWSVKTRRKLRSLDHANIGVMIAGTYTPLCFNVLSGWVRVALLGAIWMLAAAGIVVALFAERVPRRVNALLYIGMGWVALFALPAFLARLPWAFVATLLLGGALYTIGALIYAQRRPNPFPRVFGFHEIFHLFVITGSIAFAAAIWVWALPIPRL